MDFNFPTVKLKPLADDMEVLLDQTNPFALITAAHLMTRHPNMIPIKDLS
jgi:hypothetical protein